MNFDKSKQQLKKRQRKRNITDYNPPFNAASDVNLGKEVDTKPMNVLQKEHEVPLKNNAHNMFYLPHTFVIKGTGERLQ